MKKEKAVILLSGGLDSTTVLAIAKNQGYACYALSFAYGQRHVIELEAAEKIAKLFHCIEHRVLTIDLGGFGGSALTDTSIAVPEHATSGIPATYVPARNTIFLANALAYAEVIAADAIFIGVNAVDYSGYPDCRPGYLNAFEVMANLATKRAVEGEKIRFEAPLIDLSKAEIIQAGLRLGIDYHQTISCYQVDQRGNACGKCDSCRLRKQGFLQAGIEDATHYKN